MVYNYIYQMFGGKQMKNLVNGIHHVSLKCRKGQEYDKVEDFYSNVLGLETARVWEDGIMFDTGNGVIEIFTNREDAADTGVIRHFAFSVNDTDRCAAAVREAGYEVFIEPKDIVIPSKKPLSARIAFCFGPLGEQIEFFQVK